MADGAFTPEVKEAILRRAQFRCDRCGLRANTGHFHHRTPRRSGGTSRDDLGWASNGLLLHPRCHDWIEGKRKIAAQLGYLVGYGSLPEDVPVYLWSGWAWLNRDGTLTKIEGTPPINAKRPAPSPAGESLDAEAEVPR